METEIGKHGILDFSAKRYIFKYQPINKYSKLNLTNKKLWASNPSAFNDPFEFQYLQDGINTKASDFDLVFDEIHKSKVICLTSDPDNLLMWAHYADFHKGMCLGFYNNTLSYAINYSNEFPKIDFNGDYSQKVHSLVKILFTKSKEWEYEQERRMVFFKDTPSEIRYPGELFLVIFGMRTEQSQIDEIKAIVNDKDVLYWKCKIVPGHYKIDFDPV